MSQKPRVLILTPVKDGAKHLDRYFALLDRLSYPKDCLSIGLLEGDSKDDTYAQIADRLPMLRDQYADAGLWKRDFGFQLAEGLHRHVETIQLERRKAIAKARNHLLFRALGDEDWVLWLDVDVIDYPADIIERLLSAGKDIVHPNCVHRYGGRSYDLNAWRDKGKRHLHDLKTEGKIVELHSVGGTMLLVRADVHRDGLVFPAFPYGLKNERIREDNVWQGEIETEGLAIMAHDMGVTCWGLPWLEIKHHKD